MGAIEVGGNSLIVDLHQAQRGRYLNLLAVFHGIGSLAVPIYAAFLLQNSFSWRQVYSFTLLLAILLTLWTASSAIRALSISLDRVYGVGEPRRYVFQRLVSFDGAPAAV